jgi:hypothetical protein
MATQTTARSIDRAVSLNLDLAGAKLGAFGNAMGRANVGIQRLDLPGQVELELGLDHQTIAVHTQIQPVLDAPGMSARNVIPSPRATLCNTRSLRPTTGLSHWPRW